MWRSGGLVVGLLSISVMLSACGGGDSNYRSKACPINANTKFADRLLDVSLEEAGKRSQFGVGLPAKLPPGVSLSSVAIDPDPGCPDKRINVLQLAYSGPGYSLTIWESPKAETSDVTVVDGLPIRIGGVDGKVTRRTNNGEQRVTVYWPGSDRFYMASAALTGGLSEAGFLQILESIPK